MTLWRIYLHWPQLSLMQTLFHLPNYWSLEENCFPAYDKDFVFLCFCGRIEDQILPIITLEAI